MSVNDEYYYQCQSFCRGKHIREILEYSHQVGHWVEKQMEQMRVCDVILIEAVRGNYKRAVLQQLKNYKEEKKNAEPDQR